MTWYIELGKALKEIGIPVGAFILLCWLVVYIVKRLAKSIDDLVTEFKITGTHVRKEHEQHHDQHKALMDDHAEITKQLNDTALTLAKINSR